MKGFILCVAIICLLTPNILPIHSGRTDGDGGHYNHDTGEYHYHHGYSAHQHYDGVCPYDEEDYDCGREDCNIQGQHYHANKATTTTSRTQKQESDSVSKDSSSDWLVPLCFILLLVIGVALSNFDEVKRIVSKRRKKGKHEK